MVNLSFTAKTWVVAAILTATSLSAQEKCKTQNGYAQGREVAQAQMMSGYNAPARIDVRGAWDFYLTGSFIYFQPTEDNLELAISSSSTTGTEVALPIDGSVVNMDFDYKPGFKVGLGMNFDHDNWDVFAEYTRLHCTNSQSADRVTNGRLFSLWRHPDLQTAANAYSALSGKWRFNLDLLDLSLGRCYFVGTKLTFRPYFGGRAAWINQRYNVTGTLASSTTTLSTGRNKSNSWGLGARVGVDTEWMMGCGFRLFGNGSADILYTQYHMSQSQQDPVTPTTIDLNVSQTKLSCVRPHADLELGFGWGSYFDNNNWHIDFAAGYGFQVFWNQNMFRKYYAPDGLGLSSVALGDLYLQGMTLTARLDF